MEDQASFRVRYDFAGPQFQKYHDLYRLHTETFSLPKTWSVEPGTTDIGHDHSRGEWIFHGEIFHFSLIDHFMCVILGDRKHLNDAKKDVAGFYKDLTVTVEDVNQRSVHVV